MADKELVIKISEEAYNRVLKSGVIYGSDTAYIGGAIIDSIELPENHGRLKDVDVLIDSLGCSDRDIYCKAVIEEDAPTIIDADTKESEKYYDK